MKRIMIMGCSGSGKTTLSNRLGLILNMEVIHLDQHYWKGGWQAEPTKAEWEAIVKALIEREEWVMDGNYGGTKEMRFAKADTIIFLDRSRWQCLWRVLKRTWNYFGKPRPDMPEGCPERISFEFYHYILFYNSTRRPTILQYLEEMKNQKTIHILRSDDAVERFLQQIEKQNYNNAIT